MIAEKILYGETIALRQIEISDCTLAYAAWMNDTQVNQYLETRWSVQTLDSITEFVRYQRENSHSVLFAMILQAEKRHIGNIKIGPVNWHYKNADISYVIGDKKCWGKGIATEAVRLICAYAFEELGLHKTEAGAYAAAAGSWKALEKNGFVREGIFREKVFSGSEYMDVYRYGLLDREYKELIHKEQKR